MKTINVYLTKQQKQKADKVRIKYKVSLSTLAGIVSYELVHSLIRESKKNMIEELQDHYIQEKGNYKTSIKPRELTGKDQYLNKLIQHKNKFTSNALIIYLDGKIKEYVDDINHYYANIDKKLTQAYDVYWDYNTMVRSQARAIRQNKKYYKKILENED